MQVDTGIYKIAIIDNKMGLLKKFIEGYKRKKEKYQEVEEDYQVQKMLVQRQKNANERELESYYEELRQRKINSELAKMRKMKQDEMWKGNVFKNGNRKLYCDKSLMKEPKWRLAR